MTPQNETQNVLVSNHWLYELREELGFDIKCKSRIGTGDHDIFRNETGNALMAFYNNFNPDVIAKSLAEEI